MPQREVQLDARQTFWSVLTLVFLGSASAQTLIYFTMTAGWALWVAVALVIAGGGCSLMIRHAPAESHADL